MSGQHSELPPSDLARTVACPGSVLLQARFPDTEDSPEALEGDAAHWVLSEMMQGRPAPAVETRAPNGVFVTQEMIDGAHIMVEDVEILLEGTGVAITDGASEVAVAIPRVHERCWGTPDYRVWLPPPPRPTLAVYDYKFGHRHVEVFENAQMVAYVAGCLSATRLSDLEVDVIVKIVQPRAFHRDGPVREWRLNGADIRGLVNVLSNAAAEALGPSPRTFAGPHCRDCRARHACPTLQRQGYSWRENAGGTLPLELSPHAAGLELAVLDDAIRMLEARRSGLEEQIVSLMRTGVDVPHWRLEQGLGRQSWTIPDAQVIALGKALGVDVAKPPEAITPKQAIERGLPLHAMPNLFKTPKAAVKLVRDDGSKARRVFGG